MAEMVEQTTQGRTTTKWLTNVLNPQTFLWIMAGFVSVVIFWKDSKDNWAKIGTKADESEIQALKAQVNDLQSKVNSQYTTQRMMNDNTNKAIEEVADWMHEQIGFQKALTETKK